MNEKACWKKANERVWRILEIASEMSMVFEKRGILKAFGS